MHISDEHAEAVIAFALIDYTEKLGQFIQLRDRLGPGHPDTIKAHDYLEQAKRLRSEVDPNWEEHPQAAA